MDKIVVLLAILGLMQVTLACRCRQTHPQTQYCASEFAIRGRVLSYSRIGRFISYTVSVDQSYRESDDCSLGFTFEIRSARNSAGCGVRLNVNDVYLLSGTCGRNQSTVGYISSCGFNRPFDQLTEAQIQGVERYYSCGCEIVYSGDHNDDDDDDDHSDGDEDSDDNYRGVSEAYYGYDDDDHSREWRFLKYRGRGSSSSGSSSGSESGEGRVYRRRSRRGKGFGPYDRYGRIGRYFGLRQGRLYSEDGSDFSDGYGDDFGDDSGYDSSSPSSSGQDYDEYNRGYRRSIRGSNGSGGRSEYVSESGSSGSSGEHGYYRGRYGRKYGRGRYRSGRKFKGFRGGFYRRRGTGSSEESHGSSERRKRATSLRDGICRISDANVSDRCLRKHAQCIYLFEEQRCQWRINTDECEIDRRQS